MHSCSGDEIGITVHRVGCGPAQKNAAVFAAGNGMRAHLRKNLHLEFFFCSIEIIEGQSESCSATSFDIAKIKFAEQASSEPNLKFGAVHIDDRLQR